MTLVRLFHCRAPPPPLTSAYCYTKDLLQLEACKSSREQVLPDHARIITTPLMVAAWEQALHRHPDRPFCDYIVRGIREGFHVGFDGTLCSPVGTPSNMRSAEQNPAPVEAYLATELAAGRITEVDQQYASGIIISRFGVIPKRGQPNQWHLILDLSHPPGHSINDGVQPTLSSLHYVSVDDAVQRTLQLGQGALLAKVDIEHAYQNVPIHPDDRPLLGMQWNSRLFVDKTLPFGLRSAPKIFTALADALQWIVQARGVDWLIH